MRWVSSATTVARAFGRRIRCSDLSLFLSLLLLVIHHHANYDDQRRSAHPPIGLFFRSVPYRKTLSGAAVLCHGSSVPIDVPLFSGTAPENVSVCPSEEAFS